MLTLIWSVCVLFWLGVIFNVGQRNGAFVVLNGFLAGWASLVLYTYYTTPP